MRKRTLGVGLAIVAGLVAGCQAGPQPATRASRQPPSPSTPQRIVSLVPAGTQMLFAIGAGPRVVGVSSFDRDPAEVRRLPKVGALLDPSTEQIVRLRPDLVVIDASQVEVRDTLTGMRIPVMTYSHPGLSDIMKTIRELGARLGLEVPAGRVAAVMESRLDRVRAGVAGRPRPSALIVFGREPASLRGIYASGGVGFLADIVDVAGGRNVFADIRRESLQAGTEIILAARPEVIVELQPGEGGAGIRQAESAWQALASVPAVANRRVYVLVGDEFVVPGPRVAEAAERIARLLHPDASWEGAAGATPRRRN